MVHHFYDHSRYCQVYLLRSKDEALDAFKLYKLEVENQRGVTIKNLRSDRGGEYVIPIGEFCKLNGIIHETNAPSSPESNGVAERKNRTLIDMVNAMLASSGLPSNLWGEAILSACYILNRVPFKKSDKTPYELWKGRQPSYAYFKVWGCLAKVATPRSKKTKIGPKTVDCVFLGYPEHTSAYRFMVIGENTIMESRDAVFFEHIFPLGSGPHKRVRDDLSDVPSTSQPPSLDAETEPRRSNRVRTEKIFGPDFVTLTVESEPQTYKKAMTSPEAPFWEEASNNEWDSIQQNETWELVDLPPGSKTIGCKWVFKRKLRTDGTIEKHKARLVDKGYRQQEGLDFFDTYSPVTRITSIRMLIAIASIYDLHIHQMDVKTAFLYGELNEEIYMDQPEGFVVKGYEDKVCKLKKSLYV